jgi:hypothetical protein
MKTVNTTALLALWLLTNSAVVFTAPTANAATRPLTYANAVSFFKAAKFRATEVPTTLHYLLRRPMEEREYLRLLRRHG